MGEYVFCSSCGAQNEKIKGKDFVFCQQCGFKIVYQGNSMPIGAEPPQAVEPKFVSQQKTPAQNPIPAVKPAVQSWSSAPPRKRANGFGIAGLVLAVIGAIFLGINSTLAGIILIISLICTIGGLLTSFSKKHPKDKVVPIIGIVIGVIALILAFAIPGTSYKAVPAEERDAFVTSCQYVDYNELARNPNAYKGMNIVVTIQINQVVADGTDFRAYEDYNMDIENPDASYLTKEWYLQYRPREGEARILEGDVLTCYGTFDGTIKVTRAFTGTKDSVPSLVVQFYDTP